MKQRVILLATACMVAAVASARADRQRIAPGTALQSEVVVDTGANGICETTARPDDLQAAAVGGGTAFQAAVRCGPDGVASSTAAGDDRQLVALGADCQNRNTVLVDSGPDGIANSSAAGDDVQLIPVGMATANSPCVITGANGRADTNDPIGGDDVRLIATGTALPNATVVTCGPNRVVDTHANNVNPSGDDVQLLPFGQACQNANTPVIDSGIAGIADTRAEGPDFLLGVVRPLKITLSRRRGTASRRVKVTVANVEFGATAPAARTYALVVADGSCPNRTVSQVDADGRAPGLQGTATVARGRQAKGSFVVQLSLAEVTSVARNIPFRCAVHVEAQALDTAPALDDAVNPATNQADVVLESVDLSDLR